MCTVVPDSGELEMEAVEGSKMDMKIYFSGGESQLFRTDLQGYNPCFYFKAYFAWVNHIVVSCVGVLLFHYDDFVFRK